MQQVKQELKQQSEIVLSSITKSNKVITNITKNNGSNLNP